VSAAAYSGQARRRRAAAAEAERQAAAAYKRRQEQQTPFIRATFIYEPPEPPPVEQVLQERVKAGPVLVFDEQGRFHAILQLRATGAKETSGVRWQHPVFK
jgi:hypothetical protein